MAKIIDKNKAQSILLEANTNKKKQTDKVGLDISTILRGSHKTYKYILITALLSKASNKEIDILSLQSGDKSKGSYDARSICHEIIVPFEREYCPNSIGGSNEPFLNKPARYTRLSTSNAVRRGKDKLTLELLISTLSNITTCNLAFTYLCSAISELYNIHDELKSKFNLEGLSLSNKLNIQMLLDYIYILTKKTLEGEICPIIVATIEQLFLEEKYKVIPHKINESGSSSKEVGDIDIFDKKNNIIASIEVKDKNFSKEDVEHAIKKFVEANVQNTLFIYGKNISFNKKEVFQTAARFGRYGFYCCVISIIDYSKLRFINIANNSITFDLFVIKLLEVANIINAKDDTIRWIKDAATQISESKAGDLD